MRGPTAIIAAVAISAEFCLGSNCQCREVEAARGRNFGSEIIVKGETFPGIDASGSSDSAPHINEAIRGGGRVLELPCGTYLVKSGITAPSRTELKGSGPCTKIKVSPALAQNYNIAQMPGGRADFASVFSNENFVAGNSNIHIHNLTVDASDGLHEKKFVHLIFMYNSTEVLIDNVTLIGAKGLSVQDGVAFVKSSYFEVRNSKSESVANACYDVWGGSHDFSIHNNICDGDGKVEYGILLNGLVNSNEKGVTHAATVNNNEVRNVRGIGIWIGGLWNQSEKSPLFGLVKDLRVAGNLVENVALRSGIAVTDSEDIQIEDNRIHNVGANGIAVSSQFTGASSRIDISRNMISSSNTRCIDADGIRIGRRADEVKLVRNTVFGELHKYAIRIDPEAKHIEVVKGKMQRGTAGLLSGSGL